MTWVGIAVGAVVTLAGIVVGAVLQAWLSEGQRRRERDEAQRAARIERVAHVIGRASTALDDVRPELMVWGKTETIQEAWASTWGPLRNDLGIAAAMESEESLRKKLLSLDDAMASLFTYLTFLVTPSLRQAHHEAGHRENVYETAQEKHKAAEALIRSILDQVHAAPPVSKSWLSRLRP